MHYVTGANVLITPMTTGPQSPAHLLSSVLILHSCFTTYELRRHTHNTRPAYTDNVNNNCNVVDILLVLRPKLELDFRSMDSLTSVCCREAASRCWMFIHPHRTQILSFFFLSHPGRHRLSTSPPRHDHHCADWRPARWLSALQPHHVNNQCQETDELWR